MNDLAIPLKHKLDSDRLSFLDGQRVYIELRGPVDGYMAFDGDGWIVRLKSANGVLLPIEDSPFATLRDAIDGLEREVS